MKNWAWWPCVASRRDVGVAVLQMLPTQCGDSPRSSRAALRVHDPGVTSPKECGPECAHRRFTSSLLTRSRSEIDIDALAEWHGLGQQRHVGQSTPDATWVLLRRRTLAHGFWTCLDWFSAPPPFVSGWHFSAQDWDQRLPESEETRCHTLHLLIGKVFQYFGTFTWILPNAVSHRLLL